MDAVSKNALVDAAGKGNVCEDLIQRTLYSYDGTGQRELPEVVVRAVDTEQISRVLKTCNEWGVPVTARGAGSSLSGGPVPVNGGVVLDMAGFNHIISISPEDQVAVVQPGVVNGDLQEALGQFGLFYPPDPASFNFSTLGGNLAENAGGLKAVKYGVTGNYVLGLTAVLADGRVIKTGGKSVKNVVGYDLTRLLVGSEGTLAIIVEANLKVIPLPESKATLRSFFPSAEGAAQAVQAVLQSGIRPVAMEFLDNASIDAVFHAVGGDKPQGAAAMLLIELDGDREVVARQSKSLKQIVTDKQGIDVRLATEPKDMDALWTLRNKLGPAVTSMNSGDFAEDIVVPLGRIATMVSKVQGIAAKNNLSIYNYGHAGDGNLHVNILFDKTSEDETKRARQAIHDVFEAALEEGGSMSGEHGVGNTKRPFMGLEVDTATAQIMLAVKKAFDPKGILNPGKAIVPASMAGCEA